MSELSDEHYLKINQVYSKENIPVISVHIVIARQEDEDRWPHLSGIDLPQIYSCIDLLMGYSDSLMMESDVLENTLDF